MRNVGGRVPFMRAMVMVVVMLFMARKRSMIRMMIMVVAMDRTRVILLMVLTSAWLLGLRPWLELSLGEVLHVCRGALGSRLLDKTVSIRYWHLDLL